MRPASPFALVSIAIVFVLGTLGFGTFLYSSPKKLDSSESPESLESKLRHIDDKLNSFLWFFLREAKEKRIHKTRLLTSTKCPRKYKLLILVTSHLENRQRRDLIRNTWGRKQDLMKYDVYLSFMVGFTHRGEIMKAIAQENDTYGDIMQGKILEDFHRLAYKVEMGFEWSVLYCDYDVMLKVDDDVFINIPNALALYNGADVPKRLLYVGVVHYGGPVLREGRYGVSLDEFPDDHYPPYCAGGGFMISRDAVEKMLPHLDLYEPLIIDDAYVGVVAQKAGVRALDRHKHFLMWEDDCTYRSLAVAQHPAKIEECMKYLYLTSLGLNSTSPDTLTRELLTFPVSNTGNGNGNGNG